MAWGHISKICWFLSFFFTSFLCADEPAYLSPDVVENILSNPSVVESLFSPPGKMVDVGGYKLHLCNRGSGGPVSIIDYDLYSMSPDWQHVQEEISKFTQSVTYDRAGIAWSKKSPFPRSSQHMVQELHTLLHNAKIPPPYILVGHGSGGLNVQLYATSYPEEVLGLVLVDSLHANQEPSLPPYTIEDLASLGFDVTKVEFCTPSGADFFLQYMFMNASLSFLPQAQEIQKIHFAFIGSGKYPEALREERDALQEGLQQLKNIDRSRIKNVPCIVISSSGEEGAHEIFSQFLQKSPAVCEKLAARKMAWDFLQRDLVAQYNNSHHLIADKSCRSIHCSQPELIVQAVRDLVEKSL